METAMFRSPCAALLLILPLAAGAADRYGEAIPEGETVPLSHIAASASAEPGEPIRISGRITEVCQAKGCWVMLEDDGQVARVMMKDHAFSLPADTRGAAVVYGRLSVKELDEGMAKHLAEDAGRSEPVARRELRVEALGVELAGG
jgi:hypothetical protein